MIAYLWRGNLPWQNCFTTHATTKKAVSDALNRLATLKYEHQATLFDGSFEGLVTLFLLTANPVFLVMREYMSIVCTQQQCMSIDYEPILSTLSRNRENKLDWLHLPTPCLPSISSEREITPAVVPQNAEFQVAPLIEPTFSTGLQVPSSEDAQLVVLVRDKKATRYHRKDCTHAISPVRALQPGEQGTLLACKACFPK